MVYIGKGRESPEISGERMRRKKGR